MTEAEQLLQLVLERVGDVSADLDRATAHASEWQIPAAVHRAARELRLLLERVRLGVGVSL